MENNITLQKIIVAVVFVLSVLGMVGCLILGNSFTAIWAGVSALAVGALWFVLGKVAAQKEQLVTMASTIREREERIDILRKERSKYLAMFKAAAEGKHNLEQPEVPEETAVQTKPLKAAAPKKKQYRNKASGIKKDVQAVKDGRQD